MCRGGCGSGSSCFDSRGRAIVVCKSCNILLVLNNDGETYTEGNILGTTWEKKLCNETFLLHLEINDSLVGLNGAE